MDLRFINTIFGRERAVRKAEQYAFDNAFDGLTSRLITEEGHYNIERRGESVKSMYLDLVHMSWGRFLTTLVGAYICINALFALIFYWIGVDQIKGIDPTSPILDCLNAFFFSIQTFTTVGYGKLSPDSLSTNFVASLVSFVGLLSFAQATGLFFARFSKAKAHIQFSKNMLITPYQDGQSLQLRLIHLKDTKIIGLQARVIVSWLKIDDDGKMRRKFNHLDLELDSIFLFPLNWTIIHKITDASPLYQQDRASLQKKNTEVLVMIRGYDESYGQEIHSTASYDMSQLIEGAAFIPMYETEHNKTILHLDRIDDIQVFD